VWHDNAGKGKYQSWYLNYIIVHDLQTKERSYFIANKWFAVEESDGQVTSNITGAINGVTKNNHYHHDNNNSNYRYYHNITTTTTTTTRAPP